MKDWREVKQAIHKELAVIWFEEPEEVTMCKNGVFPSGAGTDGQVMANQFFLTGDTQAMGWGTVEPAMYAMLDNDKFDLDHCKIMFEYLTEGNASLMGSVLPPHCPTPWFNLPKLWQFYQDIVASYDSIGTKAEFKSLIWAWECYVNRMHWWFWNVFPWELGLSRKRVDKNYLAELKRLAGE